MSDNTHILLAAKTTEVQGWFKSSCSDCGSVAQSVWIREEFDGEEEILRMDLCETCAELAEGSVRKLYA